MAGFLYYVPGKSGKMSLQQLRESGIGYAFEDEKISFRDVVNPGELGPSGLILSAGDTTPGYYPKQQAWRKIPGTECSVGVYVGAMPGPGDCIRKKPLIGHWVECEDGQEWLAPMARGCDEPENANEDASPYIALPRVTGMDEQGNWTAGEIAPRFIPLWGIAERFLDAVTKDSGGLEQEEAHDSALVALQVNYRLGKTEIVALGLFSNDVVGAILGALIDAPTWNSWLEKKRQAPDSLDGSNTSDGLPASAEDTGLQ